MTKKEKNSSRFATQSSREEWDKEELKTNNKNNSVMNFDLHKINNFTLFNLTQQI
jgi:hypothetical protein